MNDAPIRFVVPAGQTWPCGDPTCDRPDCQPRQTPGHAHVARVAAQARLHTGRWVNAGAMEVRLG